MNLGMTKDKQFRPPVPPRESKYQQLRQQAQEAESEINRLRAMQDDLTAEEAGLAQQEVAFNEAKDAALDSAITGKPVELPAYDGRRHLKVKALLIRLPGHIGAAETKLQNTTRQASQQWQVTASAIAERLATELMADPEVAVKLCAIVAANANLDDLLAMRDTDKARGRRYLEEQI